MSEKQLKLYIDKLLNSALILFYQKYVNEIFYSLSESNFRCIAKG